ncbi:uncharacterized protein LOC114263197 [Camellia sinensis]|uniref:uncharacterized protein LOC114263197 n=1 Tax=Camellia sinensis TaxID=4442 RepID=UPI001035BEF0|nr:uncharacterized protein LOC114263197 [Camellia sinensis]
MTLYLQVTDYAMWIIVTKGPKIHAKLVDNVSVPKTEDECDEKDHRLLQDNTKAKLTLVCGLDSNEYNRISSCGTAQEIWDKLEVTYEGTDQVKESRIDMCLPKNWEAKVIAIIEVKNLSILGLDELIGSLMTHEITTKGHKDVEDKKKSGIAFKASSHEEKNEDTSEDEEYAMFSRNLKKDYKKNNHGGRRPFKKEYNKVDIQKKEPIICYECQNLGHMKIDCPKLKKLGKDYKRNKKAMIAACGERDDSSSDKVANLCLIALEEEEFTEDEVNFSYEELESSFNELLDEYRKVCAKSNGLKKLVASLSSNLDELNKENITLKNDRDTISSEKIVLKK